MDPEKAMEFILQNLARMSAKTGEHDDRLAEHEKLLVEHEKRSAEHAERMAEHAERMAEHAQRMGRIERGLEDTRGLIDRLAHAELALNQRMTALAEAQKVLAEAQTHTDQRLDALIDIVDQLIRRNGGSKPSTH